MVHMLSNVLPSFAASFGSVKEGLDAIYTVIKRYQIVYQFRAEPFVEGQLGKVYLHAQYLDINTGRTATIQIRLYAVDSKVVIGIVCESALMEVANDLVHFFSGHEQPAPPVASPLPIILTNEPTGSIVRVQTALRVGANPTSGSATLAASLLEDVYVMMESAQPTPVQAPLAVSHIFHRLSSEHWFGCEPQDRGVRSVTPATVMSMLVTRGVPLILTGIQTSPPGPLRLAFAQSLYTIFVVGANWVPLQTAWSRIVCEQAQYLASTQDPGPIKRLLVRLYKDIVSPY